MTTSCCEICSQVCNNLTNLINDVEVIKMKINCDLQVFKELIKFNARGIHHHSEVADRLRILRKTKGQCKNQNKLYFNYLHALKKYLYLLSS